MIPYDFMQALFPVALITARVATVTRSVRYPTGPGRRQRQVYTIERAAGQLLGLVAVAKKRSLLQRRPSAKATA